MKMTVISANEWVYPDVFEYASASEFIDVHAPRSGYASAQIQVCDTKAGDQIEVCYDGALEPECYRMLDVCVERNSNNEIWKVLEPDQPKPDYSTRKAPFPIFDILQPINQGGNVVEKETTAFYVCWKIPADFEPGVYTGALTLKIGGEEAVIPVEITVHKAVVPKKKHIAVTNWYHPENVGKYQGIEMYTEEWFGELKKYYALMARTRQTHIILRMDAIGIKEEAGKYTFDFSIMEKMIRFALEYGFEKLELGHLTIKNYVNLDKYWLFYRPEGRKIYANSPEGYNFLAQFLPQWVDFLQKNGWYECSVQHVGDEPSDGQTEDYRIICGIVRKFMPGMKLMDAVCHTELAGSVDCWVIPTRDYQRKRQEFEAFRKLGDELWHYTCCHPGGKWLNRFLDFELLRPRLLHYGNYRYDLKGFLHWGFNFFQGDMDHLRAHTCSISDDGVRLWPTGDSHISYPGNGNGPWMSIRAEQMRAGLEDCELLLAIAEKDPAKADELCTNVMCAFDDYTTDVLKFEENYRCILNTADQLF
ncbi:MAG: DUF4091 domain-containing protein [Clostridia bacterium]|nr:DUF4091 domain-containing protein [Clostridia bacterium]